MSDFIIYDSFELKIKDKECKELKDSIEDGKALMIKVKATHGGYVNGNKFYYTTDSMEKATKTWTTPYKKPVLLHHDDMRDPIGRVVNSEYFDMETGARSKKPKGYILLTCRITDKDSISKILDGRYMTVSVGSRPDSAVCSICDKDIIKDGKCEHIRGNIYDNNICYWNVNLKEYTEVSFVNKPADEYQHGLESSEVTDTNSEDKLNIKMDSNRAEFYLEDNIEEKNEDKLVIEDIDGTWTKDDLDLVQWLMDELDKETTSDAKLSTEQRKKLSTNVFCGPNRSFPVNDCAHYTAAKRLIGRYKGPGDTARIMACVERKGKSLGCVAEKNKDSNGEHMEEKIKLLEIQVNDLSKKVEDLTKENTTLKQEKDSLTNQMTDKSKEIVQLNDKIIKFEAEKHQNLIDKVYELRLKLGKSDVKEIKTEDEIKAYKEKLSKRTMESLLDSVSDLEIEDQKEVKPVEPSKPVTKKSVDNPTEKGTKIVDGIHEETEIKDLSDDLKK